MRSRILLGLLLLSLLLVSADMAHARKRKGGGMKGMRHARKAVSKRAPASDTVGVGKVTKLPAGCKGSLTLGAFCTIKANAGLSSMHTIPTQANTVLLINRIDVQEQIFLPSQNKRSLGAHSVEYNLADDSLRPLTLTTQTLCSAGGMTADGTIYSVGGHNFGVNGARSFKPCSNKKCDWNNDIPRIKDLRWYPSAITLPNGRLFVVGGNGGSSYNNAKSNSATYELYPPMKAGDKPRPVQFLVDTLPSNLYPMVNVLPSGKLFLFANQDSIVFDWQSGKTLKKFAKLKGGSRNYRHSAGSTILPLRATDGFKNVEFLVCGGAKEFTCGQNDECLFMRTEETALQDCARLNLGCWATAASPAACKANPAWTKDKMTVPRVMGDVVLLPDGKVLIVNGAQGGHAGYRAATKPALNAEIYDPLAPAGKRVKALGSSSIARGYHSTANLIGDGRVFIAGGNPNSNYSLKAKPNNPIPSTLVVEAFYPPYFFMGAPPIIKSAPSSIQYATKFKLTFSAKRIRNVKVVLCAPTFSTHSTSMNQRVIELAIISNSLSASIATVTAGAPPNPNVAPPQFYMLFVVVDGIPSAKAQWIQMRKRN